MDFLRTENLHNTRISVLVTTTSHYVDGAGDVEKEVYATRPYGFYDEQSRNKVKDYAKHCREQPESGRSDITDKTRTSGYKRPAIITV